MLQAFSQCGFLRKYTTHIVERNIMHPESHNYFPLITDILNYQDVADTPDRKGGRLLTLLDERGDRVVLRLSERAADNLLKVLEHGPRTD
jgi:hypothetical protein